MKRPVRRWKYDNIRAFLMFWVVVLHFLESFPGFGSLYMVCLIFTMPGFMFLSGCFARFRPGMVPRRLVLTAE